LPKYDVKCTVCGTEDEVTHKITEEHPPCHCGGKMNTHFPMGTVVNNAQFKGSGWKDNGKGGTK